MIIGIDANEANSSNRVGIGRFALELLRQFYLLRKEKSFRNIKFYLYLKEQPGSDLPEASNGWQYLVFGPKFFWTQLALPWQLYSQKVPLDVFFSTSHYGPRFSPVATVVSVMDLSFLYFPETFLKRDLWQLKNWTNYSVKKAAKVITISQASKADIMKAYGIRDEKIEVIYPGIDADLFNDRQETAEKTRLRLKYGLDSDYLLYIGTLQPRKNLKKLFQALELTVKTKKDLKLVITGKKGWLYQDLFEKREAKKLKGKLIFTGFVPDSDLPSLYRQAKALVLPSLYEGFGIPAVEAMACGIPVAVSDISSLPEIVGGAALLFDPYDAAQISQAINSACYNEKVRQRLIASGKKRAAFFSWQKSGRRLLDTLIKTAYA